MLVAAGVFPHPPALVPEVTGQRSGELDGLRDSCARAVERLFRAEPELLVVVGGGDRTAAYRPPVAGSLRPHGIDLTFGEGPAVLPLSLTLGRWLLDDRAEQTEQVPLHYEELAWDMPVQECAALGEKIADRSPRTALMIVGDGSACRDSEAAGYYDPEAVPFDDHVAAALGNGDTAALLALDQTTATRLLVSGRASWQLLGGAAKNTPVRAELLDYQAPYGIAYFVASWGL